VYDSLLTTLLESTRFQSKEGAGEGTEQSFDIKGKDLIPQGLKKAYTKTIQVGSGRFINTLTYMCRKKRQSAGNFSYLHSEKLVYD